MQWAWVKPLYHFQVSMVPHDLKYPKLTHSSFPASNLPRLNNMFYLEVEPNTSP